MIRIEVINIPFIIAILSVIGLVTFLVYQKIQQKKTLDTVIISYSDKFGDSIVEHDKQYLGFLDYKNDMLKIPLLKLMRPIPPRHLFVPTNSGKKKLYIIRMDTGRYGYRLPSLHNQVLVEKRDNFGNIIKNAKGKPIIEKHKWEFCDDVVEPDVKHWEQHIQDTLREKHKTKQDLLNKWVAAAMVGLILLAGIITIQMTTKFVTAQLKEMQTVAGQTAEKVEENAGLVNNIINRLDQKTKDPSGSG